MIPRKPDLEDNHAMDVDSYKWPHWMQYPQGLEKMFGYFESRGGEFPECTLFGLQYLVHRYLAKRLTVEQVKYAEDFAGRHGEPFNTEGWMRIAQKHEGRLPVRIRAVPEGTVVQPGNAMMTVESTGGPETAWVESVLETPLVRLWAPSTVATTSRESRKVIQRYLILTATNPEIELNHKLHCFASRGVTCKEQARICGAAHLLSFQGSDTVVGIEMANHYYDCLMSAFSIIASEHSTVTMWGRSREFEMVENYIRTSLMQRVVPAGVPKLAACVADSFDVYNFVRQVTIGHLKEMIKSSGGTFIIRPDSGDPLEVLPKIFEILAETLKDEIYVNNKGYRVLPDWIRVIQGDGIDLYSTDKILEKLTGLGWSASNIAFGSGGGLLQKWNRDTQKWAFKCSAARINGKWVDVKKDPITDPGKRSKVGRLDLIHDGKGGYKTVTLGDNEIAHRDTAMVTVYENGAILYNTTFDECRARMGMKMAA